MKTRDEIEKLKTDWIADPIWDIEKTEGFEDHAHELLFFRKEKQVEWEIEHQAAERKKREELGFPNEKMFNYLQGLEKRIEGLEKEIKTKQRQPLANLRPEL